MKHLIQKRTKKNQARTLPLYPLLAALQPHMPEWAALFVHVHAQYRENNRNLDLISFSMLTIDEPHYLIEIKKPPDF